VKGHRDMPGAATQCPGFDATAWWDGVQRKRNVPTGLIALILAILAMIGIKR
jgi:N-acetylmuramoyl-L-alanine amidase